MFKLNNCKINGLPSTQKIELNFSKITTLTGPNGTGKSTILKVLDFLFQILRGREICDLLPEHDPWYHFQSAEIEFSSDTPIKIDYIGDVQTITIEVECDNSSYHISNLHTKNKSISIPKPILGSELRSYEHQIREAEKELLRFENEISNTPYQNRQQIIQNQISQKDETIKKKEINQKKIYKNLNLAADFSEDENSTKIEISRIEFNDILSILNLPDIKLITTQSLMAQNIPELVNNLMSLKKGKKQDFNKFKINTERLNSLLQSEVDVSENTDRSQVLLINGIPYDKASTGTYITLAFFALTQSEDSNKIVLWDEPENGLHPTRRIQLLKLMQKDGRQFIIATHATEFTPVFQNDSSIFRCINKYNEFDSSVQLSIIPVATRRDAFVTLEALGIHPARTLFTANVVIWVEGPTELLFYRHWLLHRLRKNGYQEGLHYSFMQYGGSLISYLSVADDLHLTSTVDLLSHCRNAIILVGSDLKEEPRQKIEELLKPGVKRLRNEIKSTNAERSDAVLFQVTRGREIENYLPPTAIWHAMQELWSEFSTLKKNLSFDQLELGQYVKYSDAIGIFLKKGGIVDDDGLPKGRSIWGPGNKVEMMAAALTMQDFEEANLELNCSLDLNEIEKFIRSKYEVEYTNGLS